MACACLSRLAELPGATDFARLAAEQSLEEAAPLVKDGCALVFDGDRLAGLLTAENLSEFMVLRQIRLSAGKSNV